MDNKKFISIDELKKSIHGYEPSKAQLFHSQSAHLADKEFSKSIQNSSFKKVIFLGGGSASGKTEFATTYLRETSCIVFDSTLAKIEGFKIKYKQSILNDKECEVLFVYPDELSRAYIAFLNRQRKLDDKIFIDTHYGSRKTILTIIKNYPKVKVQIIESIYSSNQGILMYYRRSFTSRKEQIKFIEDIQLTKNDIIDKMRI